MIYITHVIHHLNSIATRLYILDTFYVVYIVHVTYENESVSQTVVCRAHIIFRGGIGRIAVLHCKRCITLYCKIAMRSIQSDI